MLICAPWPFHCLLKGKEIDNECKSGDVTKAWHSAVCKVHFLTISWRGSRVRLLIIVPHNPLITFIWIYERTMLVTHGVTLTSYPRI